MKRRNPVVDIEHLRRIEAACLQRVADEPDDMHLRAILAWCLFLQAMHQAGRENALRAPAWTGEVRQEEERGPCRAGERDSGALLRECLRQTTAVQHMSLSPQDHAEVEKLQRLVRLTGGECALREAEEEADRILARLVRAVLEERDPAVVP